MAQEHFEISDLRTNLIEQDFNVCWDQQLGTGVNGPVRLCIEKSTGQKYALKCVLDCPRSRQEIFIHQLVGDHPHIVVLHRVYHNTIRLDGDAVPRSRLFLVMEFMEGGELFDRISQEAFFTEETAAGYMRQIVQAVLCLHEKNIVHRDLKPENFLLTDRTKTTVLKVSDFGFAKEDRGNLTTPRFTPYYVAPQVLEAHRLQKQAIMDDAGSPGTPYTYDKSVDMWSLGVILYIMLCGYPPFYSENPNQSLTPQMRKKIMTGDYEFPPDEWNMISQDAKNIVKRLLHVDPMQRMTIQELALHPWLNRSVPARNNTPLSSPQVLANKDQWAEVKQAYAQEMTQLRLADKQVLLKTVSAANNPMIRKRKKRDILSTEEST